MAIEKGLYAAPEGIDDMLEGEMMDDDMLGEGLEIEIVDPERSRCLMVAWRLR